MGKPMKWPKQITQITTPRRKRVVIDIGDGIKRDFWIIFSRDGVQVKKHGSWKSGYFVPLAEVAEMVARRGQVREAQRALATPDKASGDVGPLFRKGA